MEDPAPYSTHPNQIFNVYKFEVAPDSLDVFRVYSWENLSSESAHDLVPDDYPLCKLIPFKSKDYYLVVQIRTWDYNTCHYYCKNIVSVDWDSMEALLKLAREKLDLLQAPINPDRPIIPQLMLAVFNEETPNDLDLKMSLRQDLEQEVITLLGYSDKVVLRMLNLVSEERIQEILQKLIHATTESQLREVLIEDLLYRAMQELSDPESQ